MFETTPSMARVWSSPQTVTQPRNVGDSPWFTDIAQTRDRLTVDLWLEFLAMWRFPKTGLPPVIIHEKKRDYPWNKLSIFHPVGYHHDYGNLHVIIQNRPPNQAFAITNCEPTSAAHLRFKPRYFLDKNQCSVCCLFKYGIYNYTDTSHCLPLFSRMPHYIPYNVGTIINNPFGNGLFITVPPIEMVTGGWFMKWCEPHY